MNSISICDFGASANSGATQTTAIQEAIDAAHSAGGGRVVIPAGDFVSGSIQLKDGVELHLDHGARLLGSDSIGDYPDLPAEMHPQGLKNYAYKAFIWAMDASGFAITGSGLIDARGSAACFTVEREEFWARVDNRPYGFCFFRCSDLRMEGVRMRSSAFWMHHHTDCQRMRFINIDIHNHSNYNNDGLDLDNCRDVIIHGCHIDTCDDAICFKSMTPGINENIVISNCILRSHYNAIKLGTETAGGLRNLSVSNCFLGGSAFPNHIMHKDSRARSAITLITADGADVENITITNCTVADVQAPVFIRRQHRRRSYYSGMPEETPAGIMRDILISNIVARDLLQASLILGVPGAPVENVVFENWLVRYNGGQSPSPEALAALTVDAKDGSYPDCDVYGELPALGCYVNHARGIELRNLRFTTDKDDTRPTIETGADADVRILNS